MLDIDPGTARSLSHAADRGMLVRNLAVRAWKDMHQHDILPTPRNFELWFTYLSDSNPALSHRLSALLGAGMAPTPQQLRLLYSDCMTQEIDIDTVVDHSEQMVEVAQAMVERVVENQASLRAYGDTLSGMAVQLDQDRTLDGLVQAVNTLTAETARASERNRALEQQLSSSSARIAKLRQDLVIALAQVTPGSTAPGATSNTPMPGVSSSTGVTPGTGVVDRNTGAAAASGDRKQAVATTGVNAAEPARGANSFSEGEARPRLESNGFQGVSGLAKDDGGVWRGTAAKDGQTVQVWLDYKGNTGQQGGAGTVAMPGAANLDGTTGNQPGTAAGRALDRTLGTNTTGANPAANAPDGTPGNPPGTAVGRAVDETLGTNTTGANPSGSSAATPR